MKIKKGDAVVVICGKDKDSKDEKKGHKVISVLPRANKLVVEGINVVTRHTKPKKMGEPGGRIEREAAIDASNVLILCPACKKAVRIGYSVTDNKKTRICKKCGASLDK